jgi:transposase
VPKQSYPTDLTKKQWAVVKALLNAPGKRGPKFGDLRTVVDAMLYVAHTGCQWRYLPTQFGPWTRVWSQFRRWSRNGTWGWLLAVLHEQARWRAGRAEPRPSMVVVDTRLARGASNSGVTLDNNGGPYGRTKGAKRAVAVDVTGLPLAARWCRRRRVSPRRPACCSTSWWTPVRPTGWSWCSSTGAHSRTRRSSCRRATSVDAAQALANFAASRTGKRKASPSRSRG